MSKANKRLATMGTIAAVPAIAYWVWAFLLGPIPFGPADSPETLPPAEIWLVGQRFAEEQMGASKSAFWGWRTDKEAVRQIGKGHFITAGWVRVENNRGGFDVLDFQCELQLQSGEWRLIDLEIPNSGARITDLDSF